MTRLGPYEVHPFAEVFPLLEGEEFDDLVSSVKSSGLRTPIILSHDQAVLVEGRNRYRACDEASVDPVFEILPAHYTEQMILDLILDANLRRRHLNPGQRAVLALSYEDHYAQAVRSAEFARKLATPGNQPVADGNATEGDPPQSHRGPQSRDHAARATGASGYGVQQAKALERDAPDLLARVRSGELTLDAATKIRKERIRQQPGPPKPEPSSQVMLTLRTHTGEEVAYPKPKSKATFNETTGDGISWAAWSWNPVTGCLHGCEYCYAREGATSERFKAAFPVGFTPLFHSERLEAPANTVIPSAYRDDPAYQRVFVCSYADLYGQWVPEDWIAQVHEAMLASPQWQYILLTKFPARYTRLQMPAGAWVGTSVDEQKRVHIAENAFRKIEGDGIRRWLSLEPLREPLEFSDLSMFDWVVIGGQTETIQPGGRLVRARAPEFDWVVRVYNQARAAGCRIHIKPNLGNGKPGMIFPDEYPV